MRILVVGAGALGGYFGGRLLQAGQDVTFLVRQRRASQLSASGLVIHSPAGDAHLPSPAALQAHQIKSPYDLVVVGCKAYDLEGTIASFATAVGPHTTILPMLNGLRHLDRLTERFGYRKVIGGLGLISATLDDTGEVLHLGKDHTLIFGELDGVRSARVDAIAAAFASSRFDSRSSDNILQAMWEKWVHIATLAGATSLMRASVGDIVRAGAQDVALGLLNECSRIAAHNGFAPSPEALGRTRAMVTAPDSPLTASLLKDIERGAPTEGDHILGDLLRRGRWSTADTVLLPLAYAQLRSYEARRARLAADAAPAERLAA
ncbi:2-dehydropantoate 2-reductase [Variovorax sp. J2P1-59]|uniref:2-dehydropantoate 2-reductase n=1 Tax=Variovorax flavidus TaxID=3053501 RepID=UPI002575C744|nr:2-dehydropantoate 2-reductase [Variovorax sp. J2P1-59]MDM0078676.1 2-dehydropantoate 2-reductase [Variovorax sp. J2P1-59]